MNHPMRAGGIAIAVAAVGIGLTGCGWDIKTEAKTSSAESTTTTSASPSTEAPAAPAAPTASAPAGQAYTIADYLKDNNITQTPLHRGDPGPTLNLPFPPGWKDAGPERTPPDAWGAIYFTDPKAAQDPSTIVTKLSKLTGNVDNDKLLEAGRGEIQNLPGFGNESQGKRTTFVGFEGFQMAGTYKQETRIIGQKTVLIPGRDGLYLLQLTAEGPIDQFEPLTEATGVIDKQTTITP
jgi:hypothetical protein